MWITSDGDEDRDHKALCNEVLGRRLLCMDDGPEIVVLLKRVTTDGSFFPVDDLNAISVS